MIASKYNAKQKVSILNVNGHQKSSKKALSPANINGVKK